MAPRNARVETCAAGRWVWGRDPCFPPVANTSPAAAPAAAPGCAETTTIATKTSAAARSDRTHGAIASVQESSATDFLMPVAPKHQVLCDLTRIRRRPGGARGDVADDCAMLSDAVASL